MAASSQLLIRLLPPIVGVLKVARDCALNRIAWVVRYLHKRYLGTHRVNSNKGT